ncbi:tail fiber domain-containing protein [Emticicia agri]|uniref:Peptidase S74 domain-containing protein n=1 Tax=Emticicia agri TaxID=2492393 RepID=A0A4Q5LTA6_9BACT|nr:tail fiber domain-containing protein [Emticicia agri]RYU92643.1 hypothetical protein EWM59_26175 [Emticicia agri]
MKKLLLYMLLPLLWAGGVCGQSSTFLPQGAVLPQMTQAARLSLSNPSNGTLVFDTDTQSYWYWQSQTPQQEVSIKMDSLPGRWVELAKDILKNNFWTLSGMAGNEIRNMNAGGFWSANPTIVERMAENSSNPPTVPTSKPGTRLMWIPGRSAFRVGTVTDTTVWSGINIGFFSFAAGYNTSAEGRFATAFGENSVASGNHATAMGQGVIAGSVSTTALGTLTSALGIYSTALGFKSVAQGAYATVLGTRNNARGGYATAMGAEVNATGNFATAMGQNTIAAGEASTAMGYFSEAVGNHTTAMGFRTKADGLYATAVGGHTLAGGMYATAIGHRTNASGDFSTAMGSKVGTGGHTGAFIIGDSDPEQKGEVVNTLDNQFMARFYNGYYLLTNHHDNRTGVQIAHGQTAWSAISDSTRKEKFVKADGESFLFRLRSLRLGSWNYKQKQHTSPERFYGPMAQEVFAAFGRDIYGTIGNDTTVSTLNMDGLLFIFAQALEKRTQELKAENETLKQRVLTQEAYSDESTRKFLQLTTENQQLKHLLQQMGSRIENLEGHLKPSDTGRLTQAGVH